MTTSVQLKHGDVLPEFSNKDNVRPEVGDGMTKVVGSDRYPFTVVKVSPSGRRIEVRADNALVKPARKSGIVEYEYTYDEDAPAYELSLRKNGRWVIIGESARSGSHFVLGQRRKYLDPHF